MTTIGVSGWMFLLVPAHSGCPAQNPESCSCSSVNAKTAIFSIQATKCECSCMTKRILKYIKFHSSVAPTEEQF